MDIGDTVRGQLFGDNWVTVCRESTLCGGSWQGRNPDGTANSWDMDFVAIVYDILKQKSDPILLDVGANTGTMCFLTSILTDLTCYSFEPTPFVYALLQRNIALNGLADRIHTFNTALSDHSGNSRIKVPSSMVESGLATLGQPVRFKEWVEYPVNVTTLDDWLAEHPLDRVDMLKIDTEGHELFVLQGARELLRKFHPCIVTEYCANNTKQGGYAPERIDDFLESLGYRGYRIAGGEDKVFVHTGEERAGKASPTGFFQGGWPRTGEGGATCWSPDRPSDKPVVLISSCQDAAQPGDQKYNGGVKLYNLWVKLLRKHGHEAYVVTASGRRESWLVEHQPYVSLEQVAKWKQEGRNLRFLTGWLPAQAFIDLADALYFYDCELYYTSTAHNDRLRSLLGRKIKALATNSRTQQAWYMATFGLSPLLIPEWSDEDVWRSRLEEKKPGLIGYMREAEGTEAEIKLIERGCRDRGCDVTFLALEGDEAAILAGMSQCDIFLGMNPGKHPLWGEGCPRSQQESLHAGCVLVAYDVNGNREYLLDNYTGLLVPRGRPDLMAKKVCALMADPAAKERLRGNAVSFATQSLTSKNRIDLLERFLDLKPVVADVVPAKAITLQKLSKLLGAPVFLAEDEVPAICRHASLAASTIVEIGTAHGASSTLFLGFSPSARVYAFDPFIKDSHGDWAASEEQTVRNVRGALQAMGKPEVMSRWHLLVKPSYEGVAGWIRPIDLLLIDGDHSYEAVRRDYDDWVGFVRSGGTILLHDSRRLPDQPPERFARGWPGPTRLARELRDDPRLELIEEVYSMTIWRKK